MPSRGAQTPVRRTPRRLRDDGRNDVAAAGSRPATDAAETGGGYFELRKAEDLATTFARVAEELHRRYAIGFEPPKLDNKTHKLEVRVHKARESARAQELRRGGG